LRIRSEQRGRAVLVYVSEIMTLFCDTEHLPLMTGDDRDFARGEPGKINEDTVYILSQWFGILCASCQNMAVTCTPTIFIYFIKHFNHFFMKLMKRNI
jgi:hypothetical protein